MDTETLTGNKSISIYVCVAGQSLVNYYKSTPLIIYTRGSRIDTDFPALAPFSTLIKAVRGAYLAPIPDRSQLSGRGPR